MPAELLLLLLLLLIMMEAPQPRHTVQYARRISKGR
ncbi:exported protein of unknown function [Nitrososphaera viennensis EN76]|uniref:Uncharacterized protein n=1 Tax=Nitrososphaera viennensis EN76 TaxID=926571 RepID=A0A060HNL4_9ARCH|nr:exported protein of unknown function [Nitrososphaera viennensis EN76]